MYIFPDIEQGRLHELIPACSLKGELGVGVEYCAGKKSLASGIKRARIRVGKKKVKLPDKVKQYTFDDIDDPLADW